MKDHMTTSRRTLLTSILQAPFCAALARHALPLRFAVKDDGPIIRHGQGPANCDYLGAREAICFRSGGTYYLHYDGAGPTGWRACLAISTDLLHWELKGPVLDLGAPGEDDAGTASSPWTVFDGEWWHMFYVGSRTTSPAPNRIPAVPYFTLAAKSRYPQGPWTKLRNMAPFRTMPGTYYADTASPGQIVKQGDEYMMFFSAAAFVEKPKKHLLRTLSIARTKNLDGEWAIDPQPILPPEQQIENSALYFEPANQTWFLFTNHIGADQDGEYTESIRAYWSRDLNLWNPDHQYVVIDRTVCTWSKRCIGMPSVVQVGSRLAVFYDASTTASGNMGRDIGLAWLELPLRV
jgi:predicted GH43/DUF377 family glycosyl hydrolase